MAMLLEFMNEAFIIEVVFASRNVVARTGVGIAAVVVICVGFLVFIIVLGIIRIRTVHQRSVEVNVEEKQEMEWDNSALTITVNPMDSEVRYPMACKGATYNFVISSLKKKDQDLVLHISRFY